MICLTTILGCTEGARPNKLNQIVNADTQGQLIIERNSSRDIKMRDLYLSVDDLPEETLLFGDNLDLSLPAGEHRVKVTNRVYSKSLEFNLEPGQTIKLQAANIPSRGLLSLIMVFSGTVPYKVSIERKSA